MSFYSIQADYGRFNPTYIGIVIRAANQANLDWLDRTASVSEAELLKLPPNQAFDAISMLSVFPHEVRHFHDFLLTPYSQRLWRLRMRALINGLQVYVGLMKQRKSEDFNCIPVPLSSWCRRSTESRLELLQCLDDQRPLGNKRQYRSCSLPLLSPDCDLLKVARDKTLDPIDRLTAVTMHYYEKMAELSNRPAEQSESFDYQPCHVFELSGLICQLQSIEADLGPKALSIFLELLYEKSNAPYLRLLRGLHEIWHRRAMAIDLSMASSVVLWALLGSYEVDGWRACPTYRFASIFMRLLKEGPPAEAMDIMDLFDLWSDATELSPVRSALEVGIRKSEEFPLRVDHVFSDKSAWVNIVDGDRFMEFIRSVCRAQKHTMREFAANPELYAYPRLYLNNPNLYVNPPVRCELTKGGVLVDERFAARGGVVYRGVESKSGSTIAQSFLRPMTLSSVDFLDSQLVYDMYIAASLSDLLFRVERRDDPDLRMAQRILREEYEALPFNADF